MCVSECVCVCVSVTKEKEDSTCKQEEHYLVSLKWGGNGEVSRRVSVEDVHELLLLKGTCPIPKKQDARSMLKRVGGTQVSGTQTGEAGTNAVHILAFGGMLALDDAPIMTARPFGSVARYCPGTMRRAADFPNVS